MRAVGFAIAALLIVVAPVFAAMDKTYESETNGRDSLSECYFWDTTYHVRFEGELAPGEAFEWISPKPVCVRQEVRLVVIERKTRGNFPELGVELIDYAGTSIPVRTWQARTGVWGGRQQVYGACNTDLGESYVMAAPFAPLNRTEWPYTLRDDDTGEYHVHWRVRNTSDQTAELYLAGEIVKDPWSGTAYAGASPWCL